MKLSRLASSIYFLARPVTILWLMLVLFRCGIEGRESSLDRADVPQLQSRASQIYRKGERFTKNRERYEEARSLYGQIYGITGDIDSYTRYCELTDRLEPILARSCFEKISNYYLRKSSWWRSPLASGSDRRQNLVLSDLYRQKSSKANNLIVRCRQRRIELVKCNYDNIRRTHQQHK